MQRGKFARLIPIALVLIVAVIAITALVSFGRSIFGGDGAPDTNLGREALLSTSLNRGVRMIVRGPIVADENFRSYEISVTSSQRTMTTYQGYRDRPIDRAVLENNIPAYEEFVHALDHAAVIEGDEFEDEDDDTRGVCPSGNLYEFEVYNGSNIVKRLWTTDCRNTIGSLEADRRQIVNLFLLQIPEQRQLLNDADF